MARTIGRGRVVLCTTGLAPDWNTLARTNAIILLDLLARRMVAANFPTRDLAPEGVFDLPILPEERRASVRLTRPDGSGVPLTVDAMPGADNYAVHSPLSFVPGLYRITNIIPATDRAPEHRRQVSFVLAVAPDESDLRSAGSTSSGLGSVGKRPTSIGGIKRIDAWSWLIAAMIAASLAELWFASRPLPVRAGEAPR